MDDLYYDSGDDWSSINFVKNIFSGGEYSNKDFSTLLFQLSWPTRNYLYHNGEKLGPYKDDINPTKLTESGLTPIHYYDLLRIQILDEVEDLFKKCESLGITPILIRSFWDNSYSSNNSFKLYEYNLIYYKTLNIFYNK